MPGSWPGTVQPSEPQTVVAPDGFALSQNYPNPFNDETLIEFRVPERPAYSSITVAVINVLGQTIKQVYSGPAIPGLYSVVWDGTNNSGNRVASGLYFYRAVFGQQQITKKMIYLK